MLRQQFWHRRSLAVSLLALLLLASPTAASAAVPAPHRQRDGAAPKPVASLEEVQQAVVRIEAVGVFKDPSEGMLMEAGSGSGFLVDPAGYVVTNNHVVTGAAFFHVYVDGRDEPVNARVLGVSECADLAVIDLQGDGYPYLSWSTSPLKVGLDVYAAGFPLGDPEYTLTRGILAKARADGESDWASVDGVVQHDAVIDHGNSGGPLVTAEGQVVGVNYAGNLDSNQFYAIGREGALEVIDSLLQGQNVDSIGVNGRAFVSEDGAFSGIWVSSVASGSPAGDAGLAPGDILLSIENVPVGQEGTMEIYCDILRSHSADSVMAVEVLRTETNQLLSGQINGRPLQPSVSLADAESESSAESQTAASSAETSDVYTEFVSVSDPDGIFSFDAPTDWKDVQHETWVFQDETVGVRLNLSRDLANFYDDWSLPGAILRFSTLLPERMAVEELLDEYRLAESCTQGDRDTLTVGDLSGTFQFWDACGGTATSGVIVALAPSETNAFYLLLELYGDQARDFNAWDTLLNSLVVTPPGTEQSSTLESTRVVTDTASPFFELVDTGGLVYDYVVVEDPAISALLPASYSDRTSVEWTNSDGEPLGFILTAAPNIADFNNSWNTPGIIVKSSVGLVEALDPDDMLLDEEIQKACTYDDRYTSTHSAFDRTYTVVVDVYEACGGTDSAYALILAQSDPIDQVILVDFVAVDDADLEAFSTFLDSFYLDPALASASPSDPAFTTVVDESGTLSLRVPTRWKDLLSEPWDLGDGPIGLAFSAAPDLQQFNDTWTTPGVFVGVSEEFADTLTPSQVLDFFDLQEDCTYDDRYTYQTTTLTGLYDVWNGCGGNNEGIFVVLAALPVDSTTPMLVLYTNLPTPEDATLFDTLIRSVAVAGAVQSSEAAAQSEMLANGSAVVVADRLNVRSGPGTSYNRVGTVASGDVLAVTGQFNACSWLQIVTPSGVEGWVSGSSDYVTLSTRCTDLPAVEAPPPPAPGAAQQSGTPDSQSNSATQGCYLFQNQLGPELTITFTDQATGQGVTFTVPGQGEVEKCFDPGIYSYTLDAPPPWSSTNDVITVQPGDQFLFPISPQE